MSKVLCIMCFDDFVTESGIDWVPHIEMFPVSGASHKKEHY